MLQGLPSMRVPERRRMPITWPLTLARVRSNPRRVNSGKVQVLCLINAIERRWNPHTGEVGLATHPKCIDEYNFLLHVFMELRKRSGFAFLDE